MNNEMNLVKPVMSKEDWLEFYEAMKRQVNDLHKNGFFETEEAYKKSLRGIEIAIKEME